MYVTLCVCRKRLFRWGKRAYDDTLEDEEEKRAVFRYGKREAATDKKRRVFRFGKRADALVGDFKYGRDTRVPDQPHVPFRFGDE